MANTLATHAEKFIHMFRELDAAVQVKRGASWDTIAAFDCHSVARDYAQNCAIDTGAAYRTIDLNSGEVREEF